MYFELEFSEFSEYADDIKFGVFMTSVIMLVINSILLKNSRRKIKYLQEQIKKLEKEKEQEVEKLEKTISNQNIIYQSKLKEIEKTFQDLVKNKSKENYKDNGQEDSDRENSDQEDNDRDNSDRDNSDPEDNDREDSDQEDNDQEDNDQEDSDPEWKVGDY